MLELQRITLKRNGKVYHVDCCREFKDSVELNEYIKRFDTKFSIGALKHKEIKTN